MRPTTQDAPKKPSIHQRIMDKSDYMAGDALDLHPDVQSLKKLLKKRFTKLLKGGMPRMGEK